MYRRLRLSSVEAILRYARCCPGKGWAVGNTAEIAADWYRQRDRLLGRNKCSALRRMGCARPCSVHRPD